MLPFFLEFADQAMPRTFLFAVVLEDDLVLAPDIAKFFHESARVMNVDPTLYCASGDRPIAMCEL